MKNAVGGAADPFPGAGHSDEGLSLVVIGSEVFVGDGPVGPQTVAVVRVEVVVGEAQRDSAVVVGPPSHDTGPEPEEVAALGDSVGLPLQRPSTLDCAGVEMTEGLSAAEVDASALLGTAVVSRHGARGAP